MTLELPSIPDNMPEKNAAIRRGQPAGSNKSQVTVKPDSHATIECRGQKTARWRTIAIGFMTLFSLAFVAATDVRAEGEGFLCHAVYACFNNGEACALSGTRIFLGGAGTEVFFDEGFITVFALKESGDGAFIASISPDQQAKITEHRRIDSGSVQVTTYHAVCGERE